MEGRSIPSWYGLGTLLFFVESKSSVDREHHGNVASCQYWYVPISLLFYNFRLTQLLVHNDFHQARGLFPLFDDLEVADLDKPVEVGETNGVGAKPNGVENIPLS